MDCMEWFYFKVTRSQKPLEFRHITKSGQLVGIIQTKFYLRVHGIPFCTSRWRNSKNIYFSVIFKYNVYCNVNEVFSNMEKKFFKILVGCSSTNSF